MKTRFAATTAIGITLLFSQGASVFIAALCPHLRTPAEACVTQTVTPTAPNEHISHMHMDSTPSKEAPSDLTKSEEASPEVSLGPPLGSCSHCAMHSRSNTNPVSFRETETAKRAGELKIALSVERVIFEPESLVAICASRAHGPPGSELPRHVLINVFRI